MIKFFHYKLKAKPELVYNENGEVIKNEDGIEQTKEVKEEQNMFVNISENNDNITVNYKLNKDDNYTDIIIPKEVGKCYDLVTARLDTSDNVRLVPVYDKITFINYSTGIAFPPTTQKIVRIVFNENDVLVYAYFRCDDISGVENIEPDNTKTMTGNIIEHSDWVKDIFPKLKNKGNFLANIDFYKTLAYLEAQVDLLTRIVLQNTNNNELSEVLKYADDNSVLNIKPLDDIKNEFVNGKNILRDKQEKYYVKIVG